MALRCVSFHERTRHLLQLIIEGTPNFWEASIPINDYTVPVSTSCSSSIVFSMRISLLGVILGSHANDQSSVVCKGRLGEQMNKTEKRQPSSLCLGHSSCWCLCYECLFQGPRTILTSVGQSKPLDATLRSQNRHLSDLRRPQGC